MSLNESIVEDAALEWFGEQCRVAPTLISAFSQGEKEEDGEVVQPRCIRTLTRPLPRGEERRRLTVRRTQTGGQSLQILQQFKPEWR
jgi:hypothetical protein